MLRGVINTEQQAEHLRNKSVSASERRVLLSKLSGSDQEADLSVPTNCEGYGRVRHFKTSTAPIWPSNPLPILPAAKALGLPDGQTAMEAQVYQNAACPWRCWYCFVPYPLLSANPKKSKWFTISELVDLFENEVDGCPRVIDLSGGSPDLVPEWPVWMMEELEARGLDHQTFLWSDDNLSTDWLMTKLSKSQLERMQSYKNYGRVCCFKGIDERSFAFNTNAEPSGFEFQLQVMDRLLDLDLDVYGYITLTDPSSDNIDSRMSAFFDRLQTIHEFLPLRIIPLQIGVYGPVEPRMNDEFDASLAVQEVAIQHWNVEIEKRFSLEDRQRPITDVSLRRSQV